MHSELAQEDRDKANHALKIRLRNRALKHIERIDARTVTVLEDNELFTREGPGPGEDVDPQIVADPKHPRRIAGSLGPLLVFRNEEPKKGCTVLEIPLLLYCETRESRAAAFGHLKRMAEANPPLLTPRTSDVMAESGPDLLADDAAKWRPASVFIGDVVDDDILCSLAALRQALETTPPLDASVQRYGNKVLRPTVSSLDSIKLPVANPGAQRSEVERIINDAAEKSSSLEDACSAYIEALGHIPLASELSLGRVVELWEKKHGEAADVWSILWGWADGAPGVLPRYHVCTVFTAHPERVPEDKIEAFWNEIAEVLCVPEVAPNQPKRNSAWVLLCQLARHYTYHLEARLPDNDGGNITCFAWWLAERVAQVLSGSTGDIHFYVEKWVKPEIDLSTFVWPLASARIKHSPIRYPTLFISQAWSLALNSQLAPCLNALQKDTLKPEVLDAMDSALASNLMFNYRPIQSDKSEAVFAFDMSIEPPFARWTEVGPEQLQRKNQALLAFRQKLTLDEEFSKALRAFPTLDAANQTFMAHVLRYRAYNGPLVNDATWERLSDDEWRESVFTGVDLNALGLFFDALIVLQIDNGEKWFFDLPHYMAMVCEKVEDTERRRHLFLYTLQSSITSGTVSAIERLLKGKRKTEYRPYIDEYRQHIENAQEHYPAWVKAKLRPYMAVFDSL